MLPECVSSYVIMLLGGAAATAMIVSHSAGGAVHKTGGFFFVWTLFALSATGGLTALLSARALWLMFRARRAGLPAA